MINHKNRDAPLLGEIREQKIIADKHGVSPNNPRGSTLDMKTSPVEGRAGILTSTKGRNGGTYEQ